MRWIALVSVLSCIAAACALDASPEPSGGARPYDRDDPRAQLDPALHHVPPEPALAASAAIDDAPSRPGRIVVHDLATGTTTLHDPPPPDSATTPALPPSSGLVPLDGAADIGAGAGLAAVEQHVRTTLINTTAYPARATVKLYTRYANNQTFSCSGSLIGDRFVLTAAHCVFNKSRGGFGVAVTVIPGLDKTYMPFGDATAVNLVSVTGYTQDDDKGADYAMITLDRRLGNTVGWLGVHASSDGQLDNDGLLMNGYPGESYSGVDQVGVTGSAESNSSSMVYYTLESEGGFSGSGVRRAANPSYVSAINTRSNCYAFPLTFSRACGVRMNGDRVTRIAGWMADRAGWSAVEPDQTGWADLWGATHAPISAIKTATGAMDLFVRGIDGAVYRQHWDGTTGYTGWVGIGGASSPEGARTGAVAAVSRAAGQIDLFITAAGGALWTKASAGGWPGTPWPGGTDWFSLGGVLVDAPAAATSSASRIDVVGRGGDNQLWWQYWAGAGWSGWLPLGGPAIAGAPAAVSWGANRVDVIARRASDGALVHFACAGACTQPSAWQAPVVLEGAVFPPDTRPALVSTGSGNLDVLIRGYPRDVWFQRFRAGAWSGWGVLGGEIFDDIGATRRGSTVELVVRGTDRAIWSGALTSAGAFTGWGWIGGDALGTPSAVALSSSELDVFVRDAVNQTRTRWWTSSGGWSP